VNVHSTSARIAPVGRAIAALVIVSSLLASCGGGLRGKAGAGVPSTPTAASADWRLPERPIPGVSERFVGNGVRGAELLWPTGESPPRRTIVFLHGWQAMPPYFYGAWLRHLVTEGNTVVYPVYQGAGTSPAALVQNALAGIAAGLHAAHADPSAVVAIGHTTGGAIAFDYAALADGEGLPVPRAVLAVYPGRNPPGGEIPLAKLFQIPAGTLLEAASGPGNRLPDGRAQALALLNGAGGVPARRRIYERIPRVSPAVPVPGSAADRRVLWAPADRLIARARKVAE
jgi:acetyl esterase/lipase